MRSNNRSCYFHALLFPASPPRLKKLLDRNDGRWYGVGNDGGGMRMTSGSFRANGGYLMPERTCTANAIRGTARALSEARCMACGTPQTKHPYRVDSEQYGGGVIYFCTGSKKCREGAKRYSDSPERQEQLKQHFEALDAGDNAHPSGGPN